MFYENLVVFLFNDGLAFPGQEKNTPIVDFTSNTMERAVFAAFLHQYVTIKINRYIIVYSVKFCTPSDFSVIFRPILDF